MKDISIDRTETLSDVTYEIVEYEPERTVKHDIEYSNTKGIERIVESALNIGIKGVGVAGATDLKRLIRETAGGAGALSSLLGAIYQLHHKLQARMQNEEVVSLERRYRRVPIIGVALEDAPGISCKASFSYERSVEGGLEISVAAIGFSSSIKYTVSDSRVVTAASGDAIIGNLLIPIDKQVVMMSVHGSREKFPVVRYLPVLEKTPPKFQARRTTMNVAKKWKQKSIDRLQGVEVPLGGTKSESLEMSVKLSIGGQSDKKTINQLEASIGLSGSVGVNAEYRLPAGDYEFSWLQQPAGARILKAG